MSESMLYHDKAMESLDSYFSQKQQRPRSPRLESDFLSEALNFEKKAIAYAEEEGVKEPTLSILYRSAATIALWAREYLDARTLCYRALSNEPADYLQRELLHILEQANFELHMSVLDKEVTDNEFAVTIVEQGFVGYGYAPIETILKLMSNFEKLIYRTTESLIHASFAAQNTKVTKTGKRELAVLASAAVPGSYSFTLKLVERRRQGNLLQNVATDTSHALMRRLMYYSNLDIENLSAEFQGKDEFLRNFIALANNLVSTNGISQTVGVTYRNEDETQVIKLDREARDYFSSSLPHLVHSTSKPTDAPVNGEEEFVEGYLKFADGFSDYVRVIKKNAERAHRVKVPREYMVDVVQPHWDSYVRVRFVKKDGIKYFTGIDPAPEPVTDES